MKATTVFANAIALLTFQSVTFLPRVHADDSYNFYFQKGNAPQSVIQGGGGQRTSGASTETGKAQPNDETPTSVVANVAPAQQTTVASQIPYEVHAREQRFSILTGLYRISDEVGSQAAYSLGGQYQFNRFLGFRLQGHFMVPENDDPRIVRRNQAAHRWGGMGSIVFTPLRLSVLDHRFLDISGHVGVMSTRKVVGGAIPADTSIEDIKTAARGFVGVSAMLAVNNNLSVDGFASLLEGGRLGRLGASLAFHF